MKILIGSKALKHFGNQYIEPTARRSWDTDYIGHFKSYEAYKGSLDVKRLYPINKGKKVIIESNGDKSLCNMHEFEIAWTPTEGEESSSSYELLTIAKNDPSVAIRIDDENYIATPDLIFTLKKSHRYLKDSPHFEKTMLDYNHLKSIGCTIPSSLKEWYKKREDETYWYKHPKLNVDKDTFFKDDQVPYKYDHDTLHLAVMHLDKPAYEYFKADTAEVNCSKDLFNALPENIKLLAVLEESYVLALERSQIPAPGAITPRKSFEIALSKICSSITSGWFRAYAYENYFKVKDMYDESYMDKFHQALSNEIIKPFHRASVMDPVEYQAAE